MVGRLIIGAVAGGGTLKNMKIIELAEELGEPLKIEGEFYYYKAKWDDLKKEQKRRGLSGGDDVRVAGFILDQLGIFFNRVYVSDMEEEYSGWVVFWG